MTPDQEISRGAQAQRLLDDPLLTEAFEAVEQTYKNAWTNTAEAQERERERLWLMLKLLRMVRSHLEQVVADGKMANERKLTEIKEKKLAGIFPIR